MDNRSLQNNTTNDQNIPFDPTKDIDLSAIESEIIDTSRGDKLDYTEIAFSKVYRFKCKSCGFTYEGKDLLTKCPRCGSTELDDSEMTQT